MADKTQTRPMTTIDALALMLIGLKLAGYITWSWWLVTLPITIPMVIGFIDALIETSKHSTKRNGVDGKGGAKV